MGLQEGFGALQTGLTKAEIDNPKLLQQIGWGPSVSVSRLAEQGIDDTARDRILNGELTEVPHGSRRDVVAADCVIAGGDHPRRLHGAVTEAVRLLIEADAQPNSTDLYPN